MPGLPSFTNELYMLIAFLVVVVVGAGRWLLSTALRAGERNTDRLIDSHERVVSALGEQRQWCGQIDTRLIAALSDRDERIIKMLTEHHEQLMSGLTEVLRWVRAGEKRSTGRTRTGAGPGGEGGTR